jgi:predicted Zn-dependent peptidase
MRAPAFVEMFLWASITGAQVERVPFEDPDRVGFGPSRFSLPDPDDHRAELGEGLVAYVAEDPTTATVELTALIGASRLDDPAGKEGLAEAIGYAMTDVGAKGLAGGVFAEKLSTMAATLEASVDNEHTRLRLSLLREDLDEGLALFVALLRKPRLDAETLEAYRRRGPTRGWNEDDPRQRAAVEFPAFIYGDHPAGRRTTEASLKALTVQDLEAFHRRFYVPNNVVLAISGGLEREQVVSALRRRFFSETWKRERVRHQGAPPVSNAGGRTVHVFDVDRLQGWMVVGHVGSVGRGKDRAALEVANYILGGGGAVWKRVHPEHPPGRAQGHFDVRLFNESRGKRGLTNDTSSYVPVGFRAPSLTFAVTSGRPESIPYLLKIIETEWRGIGEDVTEEELATAKGALTEGYFQMRYAGVHATALSLAEETFFDGGHDWAQRYVNAISAVAKEDVLQAARKYYRPDELVAVLVGPLEAVRNAEHPQYKAKLEDFGEVVVHPQ